MFQLRFSQMPDFTFLIATKHIGRKLQEIKEDLASGKDISGFLADLVRNENLTEDEIYSNVSEFMAAAVDTVSEAAEKTARFNW